MEQFSEENEINLEERFGAPEEIEKIGMDLSEFVGLTKKIESIKENEGKVFNGKQSYYVLLKTEIVNPDEPDVFKQIRATKILNLNTIYGEGGKIKIVWGKDSETGIFLREHGVKTYKDLKGIEVKLKETEPKKSGIKYLTF